MNFIEFFPYPFLVCLIPLTVVAFINRKRGLPYLLGLSMFGIYIIALLYLVFFPIPFPSDWPRNLTWKAELQTLRQVNLVPLNFWRIGGIHPVSNLMLRDVILNILLTIPFGVGVSYLHRLKFPKALLAAIIIGFSLEALQLLVRLITGLFYHSVDINDVIWNTLGALVGVGIYFTTNRIVGEQSEAKSAIP